MVHPVLEAPDEGVPVDLDIHTTATLPTPPPPAYGKDQVMPFFVTLAGDNGLPHSTFKKVTSTRVKKQREKRGAISSRCLTVFGLVMFLLGIVIIFLFHQFWSQVAGFPQCGGLRYRPNSELCCEGNIIDNPRRDLRCCGESSYNPDTHVCIPEDELPPALLQSTLNDVEDKNVKKNKGRRRHSKRPSSSSKSDHNDNFVRPTMVLTCQGTIVDSRLAQNPNLKCCGPLPYDSSSYICSDGKLLPKMNSFWMQANNTNQGIDLRDTSHKNDIMSENPLAAIVAEMMRQAQLLPETTTTSTTTTTTTTTTPKPRSHHGHPPVIYPGMREPLAAVKETVGGRMRLNCDGQVYELIGLDEAVFYTCCGKQIFDTRRYTCQMNEVESLTTPTPIPKPTPAPGLPRFISCDGSLWEITDGNPYIECCGGNVFDRRFDTCKLPSPAASPFPNFMPGVRTGRSMMPVSTEQSNQLPKFQQKQLPQLDSVMPPNWFSVLNNQANMAAVPQPICVNGQLMSTQPGAVISADLSCCQSTVYNTKMHYCCGSQLYDHRPDEMCCDGRYRHNVNGIMRCCGKQAYNPRIEMCTMSNPGGRYLQQAPPDLASPRQPLPSESMFRNRELQEQPPIFFEEAAVAIEESPRPPGGIVESYWQRISGSSS